MICRVYTRGLKDHNFLDTRVDPNRNYIFGTLTLKAIDWYINESILRGQKGGGRGSGNWGGGSPVFYWATFTEY